MFMNIVALVLVVFSGNINCDFNIACHGEQENQEQSPNPGDDKRRN